MANFWLNNGNPRKSKMVDDDMSSKWDVPILPDGRSPVINVIFEQPIVFEKLVIVKSEEEYKVSCTDYLLITLCSCLMFFLIKILNSS